MCPCHTKLCAFGCLISMPQNLNLRSQNQVCGKLLLSRKLCYFRRSRFSQCFILSTAPHYGAHIYLTAQELGRNWSNLAVCCSKGFLLYLHNLNTRVVGSRWVQVPLKCRTSPLSSGWQLRDYRITAYNFRLNKLFETARMVSCLFRYPQVI